MNKNPAVISLIGKKIGSMTRIFTEDGISIPITVVKVEPNRIVQVKNVAKDGYAAFQITTGIKKAIKFSRSIANHFAIAGVLAGDGLWEIPICGDYKAGDEISIARFIGSKLVNVRGDTKGKGYAGVIKRHNFAAQRATHGNSISHRAPGSIGQNQDPGRVFKGKKMAGHMGNKKCTVKNLRVYKIIPEKNLILIQGGIPGSNNAYVRITSSFIENKA